MNCFIIMNEANPLRAVERARLALARDTGNTQAAAAVSLHREPEVVPASWGYPDRVVVTFDPAARHF